MPTVHVIGGPNGAGKTTLAFRLIPRLISGVEFVNADLIAHGPSAFEPTKVALNAGRIVFQGLDELSKARADFAFGSTLAVRSFAPMLTRLKASGYRVALFSVWVRISDTSVRRVAERCAGAATTFARQTFAADSRAVGIMCGNSIFRSRTSGSFSIALVSRPPRLLRASRPRIQWSCAPARGRNSNVVPVLPISHEKPAPSIF